MSYLSWRTGRCRRVRPGPGRSTRCATAHERRRACRSRAGWRYSRTCSDTVAAQPAVDTDLRKLHAAAEDAGTAPAVLDEIGVGPSFAPAAARAVRRHARRARWAISPASASQPCCAPMRASYACSTAKPISTRSAPTCCRIARSAVADARRRAVSRHGVLAQRARTTRVEDSQLASVGVAQTLLARDPTLETLRLAEAWAPPAREPERYADTWFGGERKHALLLVETAAPGLRSRRAARRRRGAAVRVRASRAGAPATLEIKGRGAFARST